MTRVQREELGGETRVARSRSRETASTESTLPSQSTAAPPVFNNLRVFLLEDDSKGANPVAEYLVTNNGGVIEHNIAKAHILVAPFSVETFPLCKDAPFLYQLIELASKTTRSPCVAWPWLCDSVKAGTLVPKQAYTVPPVNPNDALPTPEPTPIHKPAVLPSIVRDPELGCEPEVQGVSPHPQPTAVEQAASPHSDGAREPPSSPPPRPTARARKSAKRPRLFMSSESSDNSGHVREKQRPQGRPTSSTSGDTGAQTSTSAQMSKGEYFARFKNRPAAARVTSKTLAREMASWEHHEAKTGTKGSLPGVVRVGNTSAGAPTNDDTLGRRVRGTRSTRRLEFADPLAQARLIGPRESVGSSHEPFPPTRATTHDSDGSRGKYGRATTYRPEYATPGRPNPSLEDVGGSRTESSAASGPRRARR